MKNTFLFALSLLILMACTQEEPIPVQQEESTKSIYKSPRIWGDETLGIDTAAFKAIAQKLIMSNMPISVCEDVHQIIQNSMEAGLGEACYLQEVISDSIKMWIPESTQTKSFFNNLLKFSFTGQTTDSIYITPEILDKVQIYWPYSENWDGVTMPLITWYGERVNSTTNYAYIYTNGQRRRIRVDNDYAKQHPVWVINSARYPHSCFPKLIIEDDDSGARNNGIWDDEEEDDDPKPKVLKTFKIVDHKMEIEFKERIPVNFEGNLGGGGGNQHYYITDEEEIDSTKSYKISVRLTDIPQNLPYNFDDGNLVLTFNAAYYNSRKINYMHTAHYIYGQNYLERKNELNNKGVTNLIDSWDPKGLDMALLVSIGCEAGDIISLYTGALSYDIGINLNNRMLTNFFNIYYNSKDEIITQKKYTWDEFFSNRYIQGYELINGFKWTYFFEEIN